MTLYHKINGSSMGQWMNEIGNFRAVIHAKMETSPCQIDHFLLGAVGSLDVIEMDLEVFRVFGFLDNTYIYNKSFIYGNFKLEL